MSSHIVNLKHKKRYFVPHRPAEELEIKVGQIQSAQTTIKNREEIPAYYISWQAPEYLHFEKTRNWTITLFAIGAAFAIMAIAAGNYFGAVLAALATFVVYLFGHRPPQSIAHKITPLGIETNGRIYLFDELQSFWILYHPPVKELILHSKKAFMPLIHLQLEYTDPNEIREILLEFLPEKEEEEPLSHIIAHLLKF